MSVSRNTKYHRMHERYTRLSSPHYFYGRSVAKLLVHNIVQKIEFFRRRGPSRSLLNETKNRKNTKKGKSALVLGSGPSLNDLNSDTAKKFFDDIFVVNNYYLHEIGKTLTPNYYCLSDPNYFVDDKTNAIHDEAALSKYLLDNKITLISSHFYRKFNTFPGVNKLYFDDREWRGIRKNVSPLRARSYGSFTLYKALAMACHFGYDRIYVLGLDNTEFNSYKGSIDNKIYINNFSHYAKTDVDLNSTTSPEGFPSGIAGRMQSYALQFADLFLFKKYRIINLDSRSLIDAFEKIDSHPAMKSGVNQ